MTQVSAPPYPGKSSELIPLGDGLNFSTPLARVEGTVVPAPLFFLRSNNPPPANLDPSAWRLRIDGRVRRPLELGLSDLQALPGLSEEVWLECAGNSRQRWDPAAEGNQWDEQAVGNAVFGGVSLIRVLDQAGIEPDAIELLTTGADADGKGTSFQRALPIDVARQPEVLLAWEMNGQPILPPNGGPVRLIVPRWAGIASVKWAVHMELINAPFQGHFNAERYIVVDAEGRTTRTVREMPVKAIFAWPANGERIPVGPHRLFGFAWSGHGPIERVDVSTDGQRTWSAAELTCGSGPYAWTRWQFSWSASQSGHARLAVRATDAQGNVQPVEAPWNKFGYEMNAIAVRDVSIG